METRKNELDDLLVQSKKFHSKLHEVDVWLSEMEGRFGMLKLASGDKTVLEQQDAEYQVEYYTKQFLPAAQPTGL